MSLINATGKISLYEIKSAGCYVVVITLTSTKKIERVFNTLGMANAYIKEMAK